MLLQIIFVLVAGYIFQLFFAEKIRSWEALKNHFLFLLPKGKKKLWMEYDSLLTANSAFYNTLSPEGRNTFIMKCSQFIFDKRFIGMEGLRITNDIQIRIAATAVQVTYGLKNSAFSHYHTIKIFPESFYSRMHDNYLKGGASSGGTLYFSWKDFEVGFADPGDRYNLGLHEMAHALRLQLKHGGDFDQRFASYSDHWEEIALPEFERMNSGNTSFLREYGGTNIEEFFAVCIEHFFEVPVEFKKQLPDIFNHLCFLLNMDPTRANDDYKLEPGFVESINSDTSRMPLPLTLKRAYQYESWHWSFNVIIAGLFVGLPAIFIFHGMVLFTGTDVLLIVASVTSLVLVFRKFLLEKGIGLFPHLLMFGMVGASPLMTTAILTTNYYIKIDYTERIYKVIGVRPFTVDEPKGYRAFYFLTLEYSAYEDYKEIRTIPAGMLRAQPPGSDIYLTVKTSTGIWRWQNYEDRSIFVAPNLK